MVMWSHEMMMQHSRMDKETISLLDQLVAKLESCKYGEKTDALEYLGYKIPRLTGDYPLSHQLVDQISLGTIRAELKELHGYVMDLCTISSGKHGDDAIINSVKVAHLGNVVYVNLDDNRCKSKQFTIEVKARYNTVEVKVYKTGSNSRYGDLRDEGHVIAWKAEIRDDLDEEIAENIWNNRNKKNLLTYLGSLDRDLFEYGVEDRNHYFCSPQMLFGVVLSDCWHSFKEKFGEIAVQPELDLFGESSK